MAKAVGADGQGRIYEIPDLEMAGGWWDKTFRVSDRELIPLPPGSRLFTMPGRRVVGWDRAAGEFSVREGLSSHGRKIRLEAVSAFLAPAYTRTHMPAVHYREQPPARALPLWAYSAVGWSKGRFVVAALRTDPRKHWDPARFDDRGLPGKIEAWLQTSPGNRLLSHLARCALRYHCFTAKNLFLERGEGALPVSPRCDARCLGCISLQGPGDCFASHERIGFVPTPEEVAEVAVRHLGSGRNRIVSFGQGCEGEPLLVGELLERSIARIRSSTERGTIHLNTCGSRPRLMRRLAREGLDSIRVSLPSTNRQRYLQYTRPRGFGLQDVEWTIAEAKQAGLFVSINLLVFPGLTDREDEVEGLVRLIRRTRLDMVQMRNLAIDPQLYIERMGRLPESRRVGIREMVRLLKQEFPALRIGYFNVPVR